MLTRFGLIFVIGVAAARSGTIHPAGLAAGLAVVLIVGIVYASWSVMLRWKQEDGTKVYESASVVRP